MQWFLLSYHNETAIQSWQDSIWSAGWWKRNEIMKIKRKKEKKVFLPHEKQRFNIQRGPNWGLEMCSLSFPSIILNLKSLFLWLHYKEFHLKLSLKILILWFTFKKNPQIMVQVSVFYFNKVFTIFSSEIFFFVSYQTEKVFTPYE